MSTPDTTPLVTATAIRAAVSGLSDTVKFPDATLDRFVRRFEDLVITTLGFSPVPRTEVETIVAGHGPLILSRPRVTAVTSLAYRGWTGTVPDPTVEGTVFIDGRELTLADGRWPRGVHVTIGYVHGADPVGPPALVDGCIEFVRAEALQQKGSQPRNVTGERTDLGWIPEPTADPAKGRWTRWTVVNEALNSVESEHPVKVA